VTVIGLFGIVIGSFLNVVIYRVPAGKSIVRPASACGSCGHAIRAWDNVPVVSWLVLRGRCRDCSVRISPRYPLVELGTGLLFALVAAWMISGRGIPTLPAGLLPAVLAGVAFLYLAAVSVALALIDLDTHRLPNVIVLPSYVVGVVLLGVSSLLSRDYSSLLSAAIGMAGLYIAYLLMALIYPGGMGFGDVKLAGVLGLWLGWLGWAPLAVGAIAAFLLGGLFSIGLLLTRKASRKTGVPFGPWMVVGAWVGILAGSPIAVSYLSLFGLGDS
jgi:leader peptidase (prepilin peptidase)/N-methyltransferase